MAFRWCALCGSSRSRCNAVGQPRLGAEMGSGGDWSGAGCRGAHGVFNCNSVGGRMQIMQRAINTATRMGPPPAAAAAATAPSSPAPQCTLVLTRHNAAASLTSTPQGTEAGWLTGVAGSSGHHPTSHPLTCRQVRSAGRRRSLPPAGHYQICHGALALQQHSAQQQQQQPVAVVHPPITMHPPGGSGAAPSTSAAAAARPMCMSLRCFQHQLRCTHRLPDPCHALEGTQNARIAACGAATTGLLTRGGNAATPSGRQHRGDPLLTRQRPAGPARLGCRRRAARQAAYQDGCWSR